MRLLRHSRQYARPPLTAVDRIGEKFIVWTAETPDIDEILSVVSLYWLTRSFPTSLYHYRVTYGTNLKPEDRIPMVTSVPLGYSQFFHEIRPSPKAFVEGQNNLVWHRRHEKVSRLHNVRAGI